MNAELSGLEHAFEHIIELSQGWVSNATIEEQARAINEVAGGEDTIGRLVRLAKGQVQLIPTHLLFISHRFGGDTDVTFVLVYVLADIAKQAMLSGKTPVGDLLEAIVHLVRRRVDMPACEANPVLLDSLRRSCVELGDSLAVPQANRGALLLRQTPPRRRLLKKLAKGVEDFLRNVMTLPLHGDGQGVIAMICKQGRILSLKVCRSSVISFFSGCLFLFETLEELLATSQLLDELSRSAWRCDERN